MYPYEKSRKAQLHEKSFSWFEGILLKVEVLLKVAFPLWQQTHGALPAYCLDFLFLTQNLHFLQCHWCPLPAAPRHPSGSLRHRYPPSSYPSCDRWCHKVPELWTVSIRLNAIVHAISGSSCFAIPVANTIGINTQIVVSVDAIIAPAEIPFLIFEKNRGKCFIEQYWQRIRCNPGKHLHIQQQCSLDKLSAGERLSWLDWISLI